MWTGPQRLVSKTGPINKIHFLGFDFPNVPSRRYQEFTGPGNNCLTFWGSDELESNTLFAKKKTNFIGLMTAFHISFLILIYKRETKVKLVIFKACTHGSKSVTRYSWQRQRAFPVAVAMQPYTFLTLTLISKIPDDMIITLTCTVSLMVVIFHPYLVPIWCHS